VDCLLMGAGIPLAIPGIIKAFARGEGAVMPLHAEGFVKGTAPEMSFHPRDYFSDPPGKMKIPAFLPIVSSHILAETLAKRASGPVDGFIIEDHTAGGHNAPPRRKGQFDHRGEPLYGSKDEVNLDRIKDLGLPFWLAGSQGLRGMVERAQALGAAGIQAGTSFVCSLESGLARPLKEKILSLVAAGKAAVTTHVQASPTGFPFKLLNMEGTAAQDEVYQQRKRRCNVGCLRIPYEKDSGDLGYRCPAEGVSAYIAKGGLAEETEGRRCLCNGLLSAIGLGQTYGDGYEEPPLVTLGTCLEGIREMIAGKWPRGKSPDDELFTAAEVVALLTAKEAGV